jgi:hypothetical protein
MVRAGPKRTIPPPSERAPPTRRWPGQVLAGAAVIAAVFLLMRCLKESPEETGSLPASDGTPQAVAEEPREAPSTGDTGARAKPEAPDKKFLAQLERSTARRLLRETPYSREVTDLVAAGRIPDAAARLEAGSAGGDRDATVVLMQLQTLCKAPDAARLEAGEPASVAATLDVELASAAPVPEDLRQRIEASVALDTEGRTKFERACRDTRFNGSAITQRLRNAADAGHEASLWALGRYIDDPEQRRRHWLSAAMLGYPAAQADLADSLLQESLLGERRNRGQMNFWLRSAAEHSPEMKARLGECVLNGCNAQPPDSAAAVVLLREATLLGELSAFAALTSVSSSDPAAPSDEELYGLRSFLQRLNETGCYGTAGYPVVALESLRSLKDIGRGLSPHALQDAEKLGNARWQNHGAAARRAQHCD